MGRAGVLTSLIVALSGCPRPAEEPESPRPQEEVAAAQREAEQALERARAAGEEARLQQQQAERARDEVRDLRRQLDEARLEAERELGLARETQARALEEAERARESARQAQQQAAELQSTLEAERTAEAERQRGEPAPPPTFPGEDPLAERPTFPPEELEEHPPPPEAGPHFVAGELVARDWNAIVLRDPSYGQIRLGIEPGTLVQLDQRPASIEELPEGARVRAAYDLPEGSPRALRIEAFSAGAGEGP
jgi:colicin import membrane protein